MVGPLVVHCSSGVDQTGVVIAVDRCVARLKQSNYADCLDEIQQIRLDYGYLVRTPKQYKLVHAACLAAAAREGRGT